MTDPTKARCFDKDWHYTRSEATDLNALFKRVRRQQKAAEAAKAKPPTNVKALPAKKEKGRG